MKTRVLAATVLAGLISACATVPGATGGGCDRTCLAETLDTYLDAVEAGDPSLAPIFNAYRHTENSVVTPLGKGIWTHFNAIGPLDRRYYDPVTENAVFFGAVDDGAEELALVSLRIHVLNGQVSEAEWHIAHRTDPGIEGEPGTTLFDVDAQISDPPPDRVVPLAERAPRAQLLAVANSYFDGITNASREIALTNPACFRRENGFPVTGRPLTEGRKWDGTDGMSDCKSGQGSFDVMNVTARRFPVVDEVNQVVIASAVFIRTPGHPKWRNHFSDVMIMDDGRLSGLFATMFYVEPTRPVPNWPESSYDGNYEVGVRGMAAE
jgi:hypothetical protein